VYLNDPLYKRQPNTGAFTFWIQFIEQAKDSFVILSGNANTIISYEENELIILFSTLPDLYARIWLVAHVFRGVIKQVLQDFDNALSIHKNGWQTGAYLNCDSACFKLAVRYFHGLAYQIFE